MYELSVRLGPGLAAPPHPRPGGRRLPPLRDRLLRACPVGRGDLFGAPGRRARAPSDGPGGEFVLCNGVSRLWARARRPRVPALACAARATFRTSAARDSPLTPTPPRSASVPSRRTPASSTGRTSSSGSSTSSPGSPTSVAWYVGAAPFCRAHPGARGSRRDLVSERAASRSRPPGAGLSREPLVRAGRRRRGRRAYSASDAQLLSSRAGPRGAA